MLSDLDSFFFYHAEPLRSTIASLRTIVRQYAEDVSESWEGNRPVYKFRGDLICSLDIDKNTEEPILIFIDDIKASDDISIDKTSPIVRVSTENEIDVATIESLLEQAIENVSQK